MTDERLTTVRGSRGDLDTSERPKTGLSLLILSVTYLGWFALSAVFGPVRIALQGRGHETADGTWASGDDL